MKTLIRTLPVLVLVLAAAASAYAQEPKVDFSRDIAPIFQQSCIKCHGLDSRHPHHHPAARLRLDDRAAAMKGGRSGKVIIPGDAKDSLLYRLLNGPVPRPAKAAGLKSDKDIPPMPKAKRGKKWKPLPKKEIALIKAWIDQGAVWPESAPKKKAAN
ncbi:MAG TPA: c-type cytochrome domain-containing protein [Elusimicrobiota bacterium]|jgi:Planctomycete cytochrome C|nr:c-type cytochrome domain-containing protein [Elusimicrobiota bacterium]